MEPKCPYFGRCGGCQTQHVPYELTLENKRKNVISAFQRFSLAVPDIVPVFSGEPYSYRTRMDFIFCRDGIGLRKKGSWGEIVPVRRCAIASEAINVILTELWAWIDEFRDALDPFELRGERGTLKYAVIRTSSQGATVIFSLSDGSKRIEEQLALIHRFADRTMASSVLAGMVAAKEDQSLPPDPFPIKGHLVMEEKILDARIVFSPIGFFQNNHPMAERMVAHVRDLLPSPLLKDMVLLDLYGGAGTFGIPLSPLFHKTFIVDTEGPNISLAAENAADQGLHVEALVKDIASLPFEPPWKGRRTIIILDPPRSGMDQKAMQKVLLQNSQIIIYVSCNPPQLAKELRTFLKSYRLNSLAVFDLFPQTNHIEVIAELIKIK